MNKALKITGITILGIIAVLYVTFLLLPFIIDLNKYNSEITKLVKEQTNMQLEMADTKLITTPFLELGLKTEGINLKLSDGSSVLQTGKFKFKIFLPSLAVLTIKATEINFEKPLITLDTNPEATQYKLFTEIETILNRINTENNAKLEEEENGWFNPEWIRIKLPNIIFTDYNLSVNDKKVNHSLHLNGEKLKIGYYNGERLKIKTYSYLMSDDKENISLNLKLDTVLPEKKKEILDSDDDKAEKIELPFINIVKIYQNYDLKTHINSKLKIRRGLDKTIRANGSFDVDNFTLRLAKYRLPNCYFHSKMRGATAYIDTNFYVTPEEKASIKGEINHRKPAIDLDIESDKIHFNNLIIFFKAVLDSFGIRNDFGDLKGQGYILSKAKIKTDFKKLKSDGKIIIRDGALVNKKIGLLITDTNSDLLFDENIFKITNTKALIGGKPLTINGTIDNKTRTDLNVFTQNLPIVGLYNAFAPSDIKKAIKLTSGNISIDAKINGKLKKSLSSLKFNLGNFGLSTVDNSMNIKNSNFNLLAEYDFAKNFLNGNISNKNFVLSLPSLNSTIKDDSLSVNFDSMNIKLNPTSVLINNASQIKLDGQINDCQKTPLINFSGTGNLSADDLRRFAGKDAKPYIDAKGILPLKFQLTGNDKKQFFIAQILSNSANYITPVHFNNIRGKQCITQLKINYKGDRLNIKDTGMFVTQTPFSDDYINNMSGAKPVFKAHGTIARLDRIEPRFNMFRFEIPEDLSGTIYALRNSVFNLKGNILVVGRLSKPFISGGLSAYDINLPTLLTKIKTVGIKLNGYSMELFSKGIDLNGSDLEVTAHSNFEFSPITKLFRLDVLSNNFDLDKVMKVSEAAAKTLPSPQSSTVSKTSSKEEIIPIEIRGKFLLKNLKTGNIKLTNTRGRVLLSRNILSVRPMMTNVFKGVIRGGINTNIVTGAIDMDLRGHNIDVEQALADAANTKDAISGTASFRMKSGLKGSTYEEQMKSLNGNVDFNIINGGYGPIGKIENLILAENIRNSQFFQTALGGIIKNITTIDSAHFSELRGLIKFKNGKAILCPITSQGTVMCLHISGDYDLLKNEADMKVRGRMGSFLSEMLGPIAALNPVNLVKATPGINVVMAKAFSLFTESITPAELNAIPNFAKASTSDFAATKFQIILRGDAAKPLSMIKSFKWLALQSEIDKAKDFTDNMPEEYLLADPSTPEAQAKAKEDAKLINRIKKKITKKK